MASFERILLIKMKDEKETYLLKTGAKEEANSVLTYTHIGHLSGTRINRLPVHSQSHLMKEL